MNDEMWVIKFIKYLMILDERWTIVLLEEQGRKKKGTTMEGVDGSNEGRSHETGHPGMKSLEPNKLKICSKENLNHEPIRLAVLII